MKNFAISVLIIALFSCVDKQDQQENGITTQIEVFLDDAFSSCPSGGVVLIAKGGKEIFSKAYGMADLELNVPMRTDHVLATGSITKQFTAVAILKLVQEGKLKLHDDVRKYVPELETFGKIITIEQVLTHTSGLPNFVDLDDFDAFAIRELSPLEIVLLTKGQSLLFEPGTEYAYSDSGYILLGLIIERQSNMSYAAYLESNIFRPAGMNNTWYVDTERIIPNRVKGYSVVNDVVVHTAYIHMSIPHAAGAIFASAGDLLIWSNALKNGEIISDSLLQKAWNPVILPDGTSTAYGYGWGLCAIAGKSTREHGGFLNGFFARLIEIPEEELLITVLVNNDADIPEPGFVARSIARILLTQNPYPVIVEPTLTDIQNWAGSYVVGENDKIHITLTENRLVYQQNDRKEIPLWAISVNDFLIDRQDDVMQVYFDSVSINENSVIQLTFTRSCKPQFKATKIK
ncbi:MAG TPA: serine hydrolase domain-containing protein [Saprospiraceae bacterium]|nr:serine hydrolase domain-containing protein [Saprospiraceae bacterium]